MQYRLLVTVLVITSVRVQSSTTYPQDPDEQLIRRVIKECTESSSRISCFAGKAAKALERALDWDVPLFDGIMLARNEKSAPQHQPRSQNSFSQLLATVANFLDTHTLTIDLTEETVQEEEGVGRAGTGEGGGKRKGLRREKKYMQYAFMVLLGIFGLTGPLVMKTLAIMAAKALIASKIALIIVGSVALKKIFEKDHNEKSSVKVHTITADDDHDRIFDAYSTVHGNTKQSPYWAYEPYVKPT